MSTNDVTALLPFIIQGVGIVLLLLTISFFRSHLAAVLMSEVGLIASLISLITDRSSEQAAIMSLVSMDSSAKFFVALIISSAILVTLLSFEYLKKFEKPEEYYLLLLIATLGASIVAASVHLISFFLGLEILSVSLYALICYSRTQERGIEASIKYVVLAGTSAAFLLFGMALIYNVCGVMEFSKIGLSTAQAGLDRSIVWVGTAFLLVGIGFKLALTPFHTWAPDVYEGAPAPISAYIATVSKGAVFAVFMRYVFLSHVLASSSVFAVISIVAISSMTVGNLLALYQRNFKRLLAYSSTAHLGYLLIALLAGERIGGFAIEFYLAAYFAMTLVAFGVVTALSIPASESRRDMDDLENYRGLLWKEPGLGLILSIALLSLAGIPLTAGFTAKFFLLRAGIDSHLWLLAVLLVINSAVALFYYLRVLVIMAATPTEPRQVERIASSRSLRAALALTVAAVLWFGIFPSPLISVVQKTVVSFGH